MAGWSVISSTTGLPDFALARYQPNGSLDTTFSGDGLVTTHIGSSGNDAARATAVARCKRTAKLLRPVGP